MILSKAKMLNPRFVYLGLALLLAGCAAAKEEAPVAVAVASGPRIYVANESSNSITVIDANSLNVVATVDSLNHSTHDLAVTRDGKLAFATNLASGKLSV